MTIIIIISYLCNKEMQLEKYHEYSIEINKLNRELWSTVAKLRTKRF